MTLSLEYNLLHNVTSEGIRTQNDQVESEEAQGRWTVGSRLPGAPPAHLRCPSPWTFPGPHDQTRLPHFKTAKSYSLPP